MEQGRLAACHAFGVACTSMPHLYPIGIYSVPELSMVGKTEEELTKDGVPYEVGVAHYREIARGAILGDDTGILKILVHRETRQLLGVHILGTAATELVHIGQAFLAFERHARRARRDGLQLPDVRRVLQGRGAGRLQQAGSQSVGLTRPDGADSSLSPPRPRSGARSRPPARPFSIVATLFPACQQSLDVAPLSEAPLSRNADRSE